MIMYQHYRENKSEASCSYNRVRVCLRRFRTLNWTLGKMYIGVEFC